MNPADSARSGVCPTCLEPFSYPYGTGAPRKHCGPKCRITHKVFLRKNRVETLPKCSTDWCDKPANRVGAGQCEACYVRQRRTGTTDKRLPAYRYQHQAGYVKLLRPGHQLADSKGCVFEHRLVLFEAIGEGPHPCYWCGAVLPWADIVVDHLNEVKADNRRENLVPSCNACNRARGAMLPFLRALRPGAVALFLEGVWRITSARVEAQAVEAEAIDPEAIHPGASANGARFVEAREARR